MKPAWIIAGVALGVLAVSRIGSPGPASLVSPAPTVEVVPPGAPIMGNPVGVQRATGGALEVVVQVARLLQQVGEHVDVLIQRLRAAGVVQ